MVPNSVFFSQSHYALKKNATVYGKNLVVRSRMKGTVGLGGEEPLNQGSLNSRIGRACRGTNRPDL